MGICGVWGVGDWLGVIDWGWGGLNFIKEIPLNIEPNESCEKVSKPQRKALFHKVFSFSYCISNIIIRIF